MSLLTRAKAKHEGRKASEIRKDLSRIHGVPTTFLSLHVEQKTKLEGIFEQEKEAAKAKKAAKKAQEAEANEEEEEETAESKMNTGALLFGLVGLSTSAITYAFMNRAAAS